MNKKEVNEHFRSHVWCIPVDKGCVVLAFLNIAFVVGCVVAEIRSLAQCMSIMEQHPSAHIAIDWGIVVAVNLVFLVYIALEVMLIVGIKKRILRYVLMYWVVGVLKLLGVLGLWIYFWVEFGFFAVTTNIVAAVLLFYMSYLRMVGHAVINIYVENLSQVNV